MKGLSEREKYNTFIRQNKHQNQKGYNSLLNNSSLAPVEG